VDLTPDQYRRFLQALKLILRLPTAAWMTSIDTHCGGDVQVRTALSRHIHGLLSVSSMFAHDPPGPQARQPTEQPPDKGAAPTQAATPPAGDAASPSLATVPAADGPEDSPPPVAGHYCIYEQIGQGGTSVVFRGKDLRLGREVAVKFLRTRISSTRRFIQEAQIAGKLQHPGVCTIHELGHLPNGRPFLVMKRVHGPTLADLLRQPGPPGQTRARALPAFQKVCEAMAYAHEHDVVHRDLKPSNIMVGPFGDVQVMDWGSALQLEPPSHAAGDLSAPPASRTPDHDAPPAGPQHPPGSWRSSNISDLGILLCNLLTGTDFLQHQAPKLDAGARLLPSNPYVPDVAGTPGYMSPEQATGDVTNVGLHSDVYSLGVILNEILSGSPPVADSGCLQSATGRFPTLSITRSRGRPHDLQGVCMKALADRPEDRYQSAKELADALERVNLRTQKRQKRLRRAAAALAAVAALLGVVLFLRLHNEEQLRQQRNEVTRQRDRARRWYTDALNTYGVLETSLARLNRQADRLPPEPRLDAEQRAFLGEVASFYARFLSDQQETDAIDMRLQAGKAYRRLAVLEHTLGRREPAIDTCMQGIAVLQRLVEADLDNVDISLSLADQWSTLSALLTQSRRFEEARSARTKALRLDEALAGRFPGELKYQARLANDYDNLAFAYSGMERYRESESTSNESVRLWEWLHKQDPDEPDYWFNVIRSHNALGKTLRDMHRHKESSTHHVTAMKLADSLVKRFPNTPEYRDELARSWLQNGISISTPARNEEAEETFRVAMSQWQWLTDTYPRVTAYRRELAGAQHNVAKILGARGDWSLPLQAVSSVGWMAAPVPHRPIFAATAVVPRKAINLHEARRLLQLAIQHQATVFTTTPTDEISREYLRNHRWGLTEVLLRSGQHVDAAKVASEVPSTYPDSWEGYYVAARSHAICVDLAKKDGKLTAAHRENLSRAYGDRAVEFLSQARDRGCPKLHEARTDPAFAPLMSRGDFQDIAGTARIQ
jgi:serine/threonine protein kinase